VLFQDRRRRLFARRWNCCAFYVQKYLESGLHASASELRHARLRPFGIFGSKAPFWPSADHFRSTPISRRFLSPSACLKGVESRCGAVALGRTYPLPPLSFGGASLVRPCPRFHTPLIGRVEGWRAGRPLDRATFPAPSTSHAAGQTLHGISRLFLCQRANRRRVASRRAADRSPRTQRLEAR
jgi:hypothetical protein